MPVHDCQSFRHAGGSLARTLERTSTTPKTTPDLYGRWLWRGGSTRSHPELGSENPLRGWYCRGHPVGEYGAAGLLLQTPALILVIRAGVCRYRYPGGPHAETQRARDRTNESDGSEAPARSFLLRVSASLRLC